LAHAGITIDYNQIYIFIIFSVIGITFIEIQIAI